MKKLRASVGIVVLLSLVGAVAGADRAGAQGALSVGNDAVKLGAGGEVLVTLSSNPGATALQLDLLFDAAKLTAGTPLASSDLIDHLVSSAEPQAGLLRIVIYSPTNSLLPAGQIARVPFNVALAAAPGLTPLDPTAAEVATPAATAVLPLTLSSGSVHIFILEADLAIELSAGASLVADGDPLTYSLVVSNPGPDAATSVEVTALAPVELTAVTWTCLGSGGANCTASGADDVSDTVDLPVGGVATYSIAGTVDTGSTFIDNLAELEAPIEVFDPNPVNDSDSVSVDVCTVDHEVLANWDIGTLAVFNACISLTVGPSFNIQPTGNVTLRSLGSVILTDGVSVESGGQLTVETP